MLPTNPWCIGIPGGDLGPVVMDFSTGRIAGGWIYAAQSAGALLPEGCVVDRDGKPTRDPNDYFNGGAILPMGEHKGFALSLVAELLAEAMLGQTTPESNWFLLTIDTGRFRQPDVLKTAAEEVLADPQFEAWGYFVDVEHPSTGPLKYPGAPFLLSGTPWGPVSPAPLLSQDNQQIFGERLGYTNDEFTGHSFRSMASTILNENSWNRDAIDRQLAHTDTNSIRATYNYAEHLEERRRMMQWWADYLDKLRSPYS